MWDEVDLAMAGMEDQKVTNDSNSMTSHGWTQSFRALSPKVVRIFAYFFGLPLMLVKEGIPIEQDPGLVGNWRPGAVPDSNDRWW